MTEIATKDTVFYAGPKLQMSGRMYLPDPALNNGAGILFCQGFGGLKEGVPVGLSTLLAQSGFTVLSFDYRGFGASEGSRDLLVPTEQADDIVHALEYLAQQSGIDPERIGLYGTSFGGGVAALAARRSNRPKALVMSVPVTSGSEWLRSITRWYEYEQLRTRATAAIAKKVLTGEIEIVDRFEIMVPDPVSATRFPGKVTLALETVYHVLNHEPVSIAHELDVPILMFGVRDDSLVPFEQTKMFFDRIKGERQLEVIETGNHWAVYETALPYVAEKTIAFFAHHLLSKSKPATRAA